MKHSVLIIVGENLIYQCSPDVKPAQGNVELMKDYAFWQQTVKNYLIKEADKPDFEMYFGDENSSKGEVPIPYDIVEIYFDAMKGKNFARRRKGVAIDVVTKKVSALLIACKVCDSEIEVPLEKAENHFPICADCRYHLNELIKEKKTKLTT